MPTTTGQRIMTFDGKRSVLADGVQRMTDGEDDDCCCVCDICSCGESKIRVIIDITETFYASEDGTGTPTRTLTEQQDRTLTGWLEGNLEYWPGDRVVDGFPFWDFDFSNATLTTMLGYACPKAIGGFGLIGGWNDPLLISLPLIFADIFGYGQGNNFCYYDPFDKTQEVTYSRELWSLFFGAGDAFLEGEDSAKYTVRIRMSCVKNAAPTCGGCGYNDDTLAAANFTLTGVYRQTGWTALDCSGGEGEQVPASIITGDGPHEITKTPGEELTIGGKTVPGATFASSMSFPDVGSYLRVDKIYWSCTTGSWHMVMTSPGSAGDILNLFPDEDGVADIDIGGGNCSGFNITMLGCYNYPIVEGEQTTGPNGELSTYVELDLGLTTDFSCDMELYT